MDVKLVSRINSRHPEIDAVECSHREDSRLVLSNRALSFPKVSTY